MRITRHLFVPLLLISALILGTAGFDSCKSDKPITKEQKIAFARDVVDAFRAVGPIIASKKPNLGPIFQKGANAADKLVDAIERDANTEIVALLADIMPVFTQIANEFTHDTTVLMLLALGDIALHFFARHFPLGDAKKLGAGPEKVKIIMEFKLRPAFGCDLRPEKCVK